MGTETNKDERNTPEYLAQLLKDKKQIQAFPNVFIHLEKLLDEEINRARLSLFHCKNGGREPLSLPEPYGPVVTLSEKLFVPVKEHPEFNFVGRILGPRGMTAKELEQFTGCKIMVRGKGSMRDKQKEEQNRGKPNWEHLNEDLHVLITVEDTGNRGEIKLSKAVEEVKKLLVPAPDGEDDLKKRQLMELAIINGTYRDTSKPSTSTSQQQQTTPMSPTCLLRPQFLRPYFTYTQENCNMDASKGRCGEAFMFHEHQNYQPLRFDQAQRFITSPLALQQTLRSPTPTGAPIILAPRMPTLPTALHTSSGNAAGLMNGAPPPLVSPTEAPSGLIYNPYEYPYSFSPATAIFEYPGMIEQSAAGAVPKVRRTLASVRDHPYAPVRVSLP